MSDIVAIVRGVYEAFDRGDVAAVLGAFDERIEWLEAVGFLYADGNPYKGPQAVAEGVFQRILADVENVALSRRHLIGGQDAVVVEGRYTGRMRATGTPLDAQFAHVWRLRNGRVVAFQQYTDTHQWSVAAGVSALGA
ncbi:MAG: nuclear transport factor 2 family protein [Acidobacteria bacterium]|nr:nuclear transport factor 2 family protein [Acidobacteriota bacterium]